MPLSTPDSGTGQQAGSIYNKLTSAFGELGENIPQVIATLPRDVADALLSAETHDAIRSTWDAYLKRQIAHLGSIDRDEVSDFQRVHSHRYARAVDAVVSIQQ